MLIELLTKECISKKSSNWKKLFKKIYNKNIENEASLQLLDKLKIFDHLETVEDFISKAEKEYNLEKKLNKEIIKKLESLKLELLDHKATGSYLITGIDDI